VTQGRLRLSGALILAAALLSFGGQPSAAQSKFSAGKVAGIVNDTSGVPQMGATVELLAESVAGVTSPFNFLTNTQGSFRGDHVSPGLYTVRVTLAGFLPTLAQHVRVQAHVTTIVRVQLESLFASLDQLRRQPTLATVESDDWKWVLRSASNTRPVLQWAEQDDSVSVNDSDTRDTRPRARVEFTDGARRTGSASNLPAAPATAFAYDQRLRNAGRLVMAAQMNYQDAAPGGGIATVWMPTGSLGAGPRTTLVLREAKLGPAGQTFRGVRMEQSGAVGLGNRAVLKYTGEYVMVGLARAASSIRPGLRLDTRLSDDWHAALIFAQENDASAPEFQNTENGGGDLASALDQLDSLPAVLWRNGRPVLEGGWHEELAVERKLSESGKLQVAAFHDDNRHVAVYGHGGDLPSADYLQDYFSNGFAYDGGSSSSWGTRAALKESISENIELAAIYAFAGALSPSDLPDGPLREMLRTSMHHSVGANVSGKVTRTGTKVEAGYTWVSGVTVSRLDAYGESLFQTDPFLHVAVRQTLPKFAPGRWQAIADCDNVLAQGYVSMTSQDGRSVLVPAFRTFRGGLSVQF
jgi:Carboxypeptidase regulatory-like domain